MKDGWNLQDQREAEEAARQLGECVRCGKSLSRNQTLVIQLFALCLDCVFCEYEYEAVRVEVSVDMLKRLRDGILP